MESQDLHPDDRVNHSDGAAMNGFVDLHGESITGVINTFDRVIFKGHLNGFFPDGAFGRYLSRRGILLKDAGPFFEAETQRIRDHVVSLAAAAGRPVEYLAGASTHRSGTSKEARARAIAERDGVTEGLVCVLSVVEPCRSFAVAPNRQTRRLEVVRRPRKCLHYYLYLIDPAVRLDARAAADLGALRDPGLRQRPGVAGAADGPGRHRVSAQRQQDHAGR